MVEYTEEATSRTIQAAGTTIHYHEAGDGPPLLFLHSYGVGTTAWITWHKVLPEFAKHFRCVMMDLVNYGGTGPVTYNEPVHSVHSRIAVALLDHLGIERTSILGNSVGGTTALVTAIAHPDRVDRLVVGACHASTGGDPYVIANYPSEGLKATRAAQADPTDENVRWYLGIHLDNQALVTDELVDYVQASYTGRPDLIEAVRQSFSVPHSNLGELASIPSPTMIIHGRFDRMVTVEQGLTIMGYIPDSRLIVLKGVGHWPPYERPEEYARYALGHLLAGG